MQVKIFSLKKQVVDFESVTGLTWEHPFYYDRSALVSCLILVLTLESV